MSKWLNLVDRTAILKHYEINVAEGHLREGTTILIAGEAKTEGQRIISATVGADVAQRICPVTAFLAKGLIAELGHPHLTAKPQVSQAIAHLIVKLSKMYVDSVLAGFSVTATIEGDHYEVLPKTASIEASHNTTIPHRLSPHAHDRSNSHFFRTSQN